MTPTRFLPADLTVTVGDTVVWEIVGSASHTVTGPGLASGVLEAGETFEATFTEPGEVAYICYLHPGMTGTVTVE